MSYLLKSSFVPAPLPAPKMQEGGYFTDGGFLLSTKHCGSNWIYLPITNPQNKIKLVPHLMF